MQASILLILILSVFGVAQSSHVHGIERRRRFDWVFDDPEFWSDFDEWRRERELERGRDGRRNGRDSRKGRDSGKGRDSRKERERDHDRHRDRDQDLDNLEPPFIILPDPSLIVSSEIPKTYTESSTSIFYPSTSAVITPTKTYPPSMKSTHSKADYSTAYTTVPESTVYTSITGRIRGMSNAASTVERSSGVFSFVAVVLGAALMAAFI